jgi:hypothetical protein
MTAKGVSSAEVVATTRVRCRVETFSLTGAVVTDGNRG